MSDNAVDVLRRIFEATASLHQRFAATQLDAVAAAATVISKATRSGHKVLAFGNGGSATDAQHLASELVGRFERERRGLAAIALTGRGGGQMGIDADVHLNVAEQSTARVQEVHRTILHAICALVEADI